MKRFERSLGIQQASCTFMRHSVKHRELTKWTTFFTIHVCFMTPCAVRETRGGRGMFLRLPLYYVCNLHELHHYFIQGTEWNVLFHFNFVAFAGVALIYVVDCKLKSGANSSREKYLRIWRRKSEIILTPWGLKVEMKLTAADAKEWDESLPTIMEKSLLIVVWREPYSHFPAEPFKLEKLIVRRHQKWFVARSVRMIWRASASLHHKHTNMGFGGAAH